MGIWDYLVIGGILLALIWAVRGCVRNHRQGNCCGGSCTHCDHGCGKYHQE